jgi:alpha-1,3-glucan synthase
MAANSYQITLLTGARGESADKLYVIASVYLVASGFWWYLYRRAQAIYVLSCPFFLYGVAFFLVGMAPFLGNLVTRGWMYNIATAIYAMASASGSFFFALNFGTEGSFLCSTSCSQHADWLV